MSSQDTALHLTAIEPAVYALPGIEPGQPFHQVLAALLGEASSRREDHNHPGEHMDPSPGAPRCSACRWFEVAIYRVGETGEYLVYTAGWSTLPGEVTIPRVRLTDSAFDVVELMTLRNTKDGVVLPRPNARALAQAASHDAAIQDAYLNRATA
jgi:hypothetical protein